MEEIAQVAGVLDNSAYSLDETNIRNSIGSYNWFQNQNFQDTIPANMPALGAARARWSSKPAQYPVGEDLESTKEYRQLAKGHVPEVQWLLFLPLSQAVEPEQLPVRRREPWKRWSR